MNPAPQKPHRPVSPAAHWFSRKRSSAMTADEVRAFEAWLVDDPANRTAFRKMEETWTLFGDASEEPAVADLQDETERTLSEWDRRNRVGVIAAGLLFAIAGGWALTQFGALELAPSQEFRTTVGQRATVTLPDRSVLTLDTNTIVRTHFSLLKRGIELEQGRAFFHVAKDRTRPFIVLAAGKSVRATGTAFDVRAENGRFEVTLIEGRVRVEDQLATSDAEHVAEIRPGWRLEADNVGRWRLDAVDIPRQTSWHDGVLSFFNEPLGQAVAEMNRYSDRKITFRGQPPETVILGNFRAGDVETFVAALEVNSFVRVVSKSEDRVELAAR